MNVRGLHCPKAVSGVTSWLTRPRLVRADEISVAGPGELYLSNPFNIEYQTIGPQPTIALRKRREAREAAGEQAPYKYEARCGEAGMTSCHVAGSIWEVSRRRDQDEEASRRCLMLVGRYLSWDQCLNVMSDLERESAELNLP